MRHLTRWLIGTVTATILLVATAGPASAHAQLESTQPNQSSVVLTSPRQVVLHFGEPVEIDFGSIRVIGPDGKRVDNGGTHHPPGDSHSVAISLPAHLPDGTYVVAWRVISADSHPVHGAFIFSVGTASGAGKANGLASDINSQSGSTAVGVVYGLIRFATFAGLLVLLGVAAMVWLVWPAGGAVRRIGRLLWASWGTLLFCTVAGIAVQGVYAASLPLTDVVRPSLFNEVLHTRFGEVEVLRIVLLLVFVPVVLAVRGRLGTGAQRVRWALPGVVLGVGLLGTPGLAGHASTGSDVILGMTLDVVHLGAAAIWLGGLVVLGALLVGGMPADDRPSDLNAIARRVSPYAFGAVVVVVTTGVVQSIRQVGSWYALFNTVYGRTLVVKVSLVVVLVGLGAVSRRLVLGGWAVPLVSRWTRTGRARSADSPSTALRAVIADHSKEPEGTAGVAVLAPAGAVALAVDDGREGIGPPRAQMGGVRRSVLSELAIALVVLAVTALLVNAVPAKQAAAQPFSQTFNVLGIQVNAIVDPAKAGPGNQFHVYILGRLGGPTAIPELDAAISLPAQGIGPLAIPLRVGGPGHYLATDVTIPLAGTWVLKLTVRTNAIDEQEVFAALPVH
jgi:copper transport protein